MPVIFTCADCGKIIQDWKVNGGLCPCGIPSNIIISGYNRTPKPITQPILENPILNTEPIANREYIPGIPSPEPIEDDDEDLPSPIVEIEKNKLTPPIIIPTIYVKQEDVFGRLRRISKG